MIARTKAIEYYKQISNKIGIDSFIMLNIIARGKILEELMNRKTDTTLGIEYATLIGLVRIFDITKKDL